MLEGSNHGVYRVTPPVLGDKDQSTLQLDVNGNLKVIIMSLLTTISQGLNVNPRVVTIPGDITLTSSDYMLIVKKVIGEPTTVYLPPNVHGEAFIIKDGKGDGAANNITLIPVSGNINGFPTYAIPTNYGSVTIVCDGTDWFVISRT